VPLSAGANLELPEFRVSDRVIMPDIPDPLADWTIQVSSKISPSFHLFINFG